jgi:serine/threonine-protein kinase
MAAPKDDAKTLGSLIESMRAGRYPDDADPLGCVDRLVAAGRAQVALLLGRQLCAARPRDHVLAMALAERLFAQMDYTGAETLLETLFDVPELAARARALCAEGAEALGDLSKARRLYEQILAEDLEYPNARHRRDRLAERLAEKAGAAQKRAEVLAPTMLSVESTGTRASRYRLLRELGRGSAATVYLARDEEIAREVALKILHPQFYGSAHAEARTRFFAEARIAAQIRHRGIVCIYDVDESLRLIAMEHCAGGTLRERLRRGPLDPFAALRLFEALLVVLEVVHAKGVIHHDLKPANLLFREPGEAGAPSGLVLGDFGTAHLGGKSTAARDPAAGTLLYMSPEQRRGQAPSPQDDLWAAGAILFETVAGAPPFSPEELLRGPDRPPALPPAVPAPLAEIVLRCLAAPAERFADAESALAATRDAARASVPSQ